MLIVPPFNFIVNIELEVFLVKFATIEVGSFTVPFDGVQPMNVVICPTSFFTLAVTVLPSCNVNLVPFVVKVFPFSINILFFDTLP